MQKTYLALAVGLALGFALAFGSFGQFVVVLACGAIGATVGLVLDGRVQIRGNSDRSR